jgi:tripartite ATP-independent transporter DctM subunit
MVLLPLLEILSRLVFSRGIPASGPIVQNLTLWVAFLGAALAAREGRLLSLATGALMPEGRIRWLSQVFANSLGAAVSTVLAYASWELLVIEKDGGMQIGAGIPVWIVEIVLPFSFAAIALRLAWRADDGWMGRTVAGACIGLGIVLSQNQAWLEGKPAWPWLVAILAASLLGGPIFVALGGAALFLFLSDGVPAAAIPVETYRLAVSPTLAAIPLFTLTGFALAQGGASERLIRLFRALFGWIPGGTAIVTAVLCAFFTVFTGGSGVTILALGGLLFPALVKDGYRERFSLGLLTASGSLGLLWPPALPLILYAIVADIPYQNLFIGGIVPGFIMLFLLAAWGVREGLRGGARRTDFASSEAVRALWAAKWEVLLPVIILVAIFGGFATIVESAALAACYALVVQVFVHKDLSITRDLLGVLQKCCVLIGSILIIFGVAMGFTSYLVDAQVASRVLAYAQAHIHSPLVFLLCLNIFLLIVGCLMDIFSAIVVVVPLILPIGAAFGIDPIHLGIIFVANLELGYLTPPVGLNLFIASVRFDRPLLEVYRAALPMLAILGIGVLLITYVPWLTTGTLALFGR